jgi:uncharacterized protein YndB with AHSA1/START domain
MTSSDFSLPPEERELVITRTFDAPRALVWKAFTEADRLEQWWGPKGFTMLVHSLDFRPGGVLHYATRSPDGHIMWGRFVYRAIQAPERIVFVSSFADEEGNTVRAPFSATWPLEILNAVTLTESDGKTVVNICGSPINATEEERDTFWSRQESVEQGFAGTFDQLAAYLAGEAKGQ